MTADTITLIRLGLFAIALLGALRQGLMHIWKGETLWAIYYGVIAAVAIAAIWGTI